MTITPLDRTHRLTNLAEQLHTLLTRTDLPPHEQAQRADELAARILRCATNLKTATASALLTADIIDLAGLDQ